VGFRLQRSIKLGKFVRLNISKSGVGISAGVRGMRISTGPRGAFINLGIPGTGLSYRKKISSSSSKSKNNKKAPSAAQAAEPQPDQASTLPSPGFLAPGHEKDLVKALEAYQAENVDEALEHFTSAAPKEAGAAIFAAAILTRQDRTDYRPIQLLEDVVQSDSEFPTPLMEKYLSDATVDIEITPNVTATVPVDGLAATLLLVELYQAQRRVREAIALLEEVEDLVGEPVLTLSLCELYASRNLWDGIIDRAKRIEPKDDITLELLIYYGRALQEQGLHEAAVTVAKKSATPRC